MKYIIIDWMSNVCFGSHDLDLTDFEDSMEILDKEVEKQMIEDGIEPYTFEGDEVENFGDYRGEYSIEEYRKDIDHLMWNGQRYVFKPDYYKAIA